MARTFAGGVTPDGRDIYSDWYFDPGLASQNWADWKFKFSTDNRRTAVAMVFNIFFAQTPQPVETDPESTYAFSATQSVNEALDAIFYNDDTYTESSWEFMTPPDPTNLDTIRNRGAKLLVTHGASDPIFSAKDKSSSAVSKELDAAPLRWKGQGLCQFSMVPGKGHGQADLRHRAVNLTASMLSSHGLNRGKRLT